MWSGSMKMSGRQFCSGALALGVLAAMALTAMATPVSAQEGLDVAVESNRLRDFFGGERSDFSHEYLNQMFGPIFPGASEDGNVFTLIIGYFNIFALIIGSILFFYNVSVGVLQSAHEGEVLGRRWSSLWAPIRIILAVGLLVPLPNYNGYNAVQGGIAYVVRGSTTVASYVWGQAFTAIVADNIPITAAASRYDPATTRSVYEIAMCMSLANYQFRNSHDGTGPGPATIGRTRGISSATPDPNNDGMSGIPDIPVASNVSSTVYTVLNDVDGQQKQHGICGSLTVPDTPTFIMKLENPGPYITRYIEAYQEAGEFAIDTMRSYTDAHVEAAARGVDFPTPNAQIRDVIVETGVLINTALRDIARDIMSADPTTTARQRITEHVAGNEACQEGFNGECHGEGWIGAGSWYMMLARINNEVVGLFAGRQTAEDPRFTNPNVPRGWFGGFTAYGRQQNETISNYEEETRAVFATFNEKFDEAANGMAQFGFRVTTTELQEARGSTSPDTVWDSPTIRDWIQYFTEGLGGVTNPTGTFLSGYANDPMIGIMNIGHALMNIGFLLIGADLIAGVVGGVGLGPISQITSLAGTLAGVAIATGSTMAYVLPMLPFLFWVLAVTGYFLLIAEAMVAGSLWAVAHMRMDGEGISGDSAKQGYLMVLALMLTPILMIFGLIIGMLIFKVTSLLITAGYSYAIAGVVSANPLSSIVGIFTLSVLMVLMYIILIERSFALVSEFPTRVLNWIGARADLTKGEEDRARIAALGTAGAVAKTSSTISTVGRVGSNRLSLAKTKSGTATPGNNTPPSP